jgi:hypothetical protein
MDKYVVTASSDGAQMFSGYTDHAIGAFSGPEISFRAVRFTIENFWQEVYNQGDGGGWVEFLRSGLVSEGDALDWRDSVFDVVEGEEFEEQEDIEHVI